MQEVSCVQTHEIHTQSESRKQTVTTENVPIGCVCVWRGVWCLSLTFPALPPLKLTKCKESLVGLGVGSACKK